MLSSALVRVRHRCWLLASSVTSNNILCPVVLGASSILAQRRCLTSKTRPKKPLTSYLLFSQKRRPELVASQPGISFLEIVEQLTEEWKSLPADEKQMFSIQSKELNEEYQRQLQEFQSSLSDFELDELREEERKKKKSKQKRKRKAEWKRLEKPKRPATSFVLFFIDNYERGEHPRDQIPQIAKMWNNLTSENKLPYQQKAKELADKYKTEIEAWEEEMIAQGREDLVRAERTRYEAKLAKEKKKKEEDS